MKMLNIQFIFSSNGHLVVEFDRHTGFTSQSRPMVEFPTSDKPRSCYEDVVGFKLTDDFLHKTNCIRSTCRLWCESYMLTFLCVDITSKDNEYFNNFVTLHY